MCVAIYVDAYSGFKANERPVRFHLDSHTHEIAAIENCWSEPGTQFFKVRTMDGKRYLLRYTEQTDEWILLSGFDGDELLQRPEVQLLAIGVETVIEAELMIAGCARCCGDQADIPFGVIIAEVIGTDVQRSDFILTQMARCPSCHRNIVEDTLVCGRQIHC